MYIYDNCFVLTDYNHLNAHHHPQDTNDPKPLRCLYFDGFKCHKLVQHQYPSLNPRKYNPMISKSKMTGKCVDRRF